MQLVEVAAFHVEIKGPFRAAGLDAGDAVHFRGDFQVLGVLRFIDEEVIDAQLVENQPVIFLVLGEQILELFFASRLLLLNGLEQIPLAAVGLVGRDLDQQLIVFADLLAQEFLLVFPGHADALKARMSHDDGVPVAAGDLGG